MSNRKKRNSEARVLTLVYIDGRWDGRVTAEVSSRTGRVLSIPRKQLKEELTSEETSHSGVYLCWGENEEVPPVYIGEADPVGKRIREHDRNARKRIRKHAGPGAWWTKTAIITTAAKSLNKAHVKYLEAQLIEDAKQAHRRGKIRLINNNTPKQPFLSEADRVNMDGFLDDILLALHALGINWFTDGARRDSSAPATKASDSGSGGNGGNGGRGENRTVESQTFVLQMPKHNIRATARIEGKKFVVQKGSKARPKWGKARHPTYPGLFERLCKKGTLKLTEDGSHRVFTKDCIFDNLSAAGSVVTGSSCNGPKTWKTADGSKTYAEWKKTQQPE